ncbi:MAG: single-stranded DNA-binding protein [Bacteroidales bacterium]|nr:single-stranded DNA-binding protein [Bacteroidales bacterium]
MNLNKVMLIGRLGKKPEVNYIKPDVPVARFSIATSETYKSKEGDKREVTEWHNITAWRFTAKFCENFLDKGMLVYIEGKLQTRKWDGQDGVTRYATDIVADNIKILEKRATQDSNTEYSQQQEEPKQQQDIMAEDPFTNTSPELNSDIDDDLPF